MSLRLNKIKPVEFDDDFVATPVLTAELKMRLQGLKKFDSEESIKNGVDLLSKCFAEDVRESVRDFLSSANVLVLYQLQAYLAYGVENMNERIENSIRDKETSKE